MSHTTKKPNSCFYEITVITKSSVILKYRELSRENDNSFKLFSMSGHANSLGKIVRHERTNARHIGQ